MRLHMEKMRCFAEVACEIAFPAMHQLSIRSSHSPHPLTGCTSQPALTFARLCTALTACPLLFALDEEQLMLWLFALCFV